MNVYGTILYLYIYPILELNSSTVPNALKTSSSLLLRSPLKRLDLPIQKKTKLIYNLMLAHDPDKNQ